MTPIHRPNKALQTDMLLILFCHFRDSIQQRRELNKSRSVITEKIYYELPMLSGVNAIGLLWTTASHHS